MRLFNRIAAGLAVIAFTATAAGAATVGGFTSFFVFGDSLSDNGNLFAATGGTSPASPPYFDGRFSNGPVWAEHVAEDFTDAGLATANFAYGGARAIPDADQIPDLPLQIGIFATSVPSAILGDRPLASLWYGANDLFGAIGNQSQPDLLQTARDAANAVTLGAAALARLGIGDVVMFNLPDLGRTPGYALFDPANAGDASAATAEFNRQLGLGQALLRAGGLQVNAIDTNALFNQLLDDPAGFGVSDATLPCIIPGVSVCSPAEAMQLAFFDPVHPNATIHGAIADAVLGDITPVPLPLPAPMLAAGLLALALLRRRMPA